MSISVMDIYGKRNTSLYTKAGFISGIVTGILNGIAVVIVILRFKEKLLLQLNELVSTLGKASPMNAQTMYNMALWVSAPATILLYSLLGILFGLVCEKYGLQAKWKILLLSVAVGLLLGLVTHLPIPPILIIASSMVAWCLFGILFILMIKK